jgi:D-threo-aldose 1-dehydrogenase
VRALGRSDLQVGAFAFGGAPLGNLGQPVPEEDWQSALAAAWDAGVRFFDTAPHYGLGLSEERLGVGLAAHPRDEFVVSTKIGRLLSPGPGSVGMDTEGFAVPAKLVRVRDYSRDGVLRSLESSLERLRTSRIDILLVHDPDDFFREALEGAFPALDDLRRQGVIRSYGAGMNQSAMLSRFVRETDLDVVLLAGRYTLFEQSALDDLLPLCSSHDVSVIAGGVFNSGLLATDHPSESAAYNYAPTSPEVLGRARKLAEVCARHGVSLPAAAVQFVLAHPAVKTVALGMRSAAEVRRNATLFDTPIPSALWADLQNNSFLRRDAPIPVA